MAHAVPVQRPLVAQADHATFVNSFEWQLGAFLRSRGDIGRVSQRRKGTEVEILLQGETIRSRGEQNGKR